MAGGSACVEASDAFAIVVAPNDEEFVVEIADDDAERRRGYMYREHVGPNDGMLFYFDDVDYHSIWMKNCKVALDIVWLDDDFRIVDVAYDRQPCPPTGACPSALPSEPARYVLEVAAGSAERAAFERGAKLVVLRDP